MAKISAKHACTQEELMFCRVFAAFGKTNAAEAYRRSHLVRIGDLWYDPADVVTSGDRVVPREDADHIPPRSAQKRAAYLLKQDHIKRYLEEIDLSPSEHARTVLAEQAAFGADSHARRAAEKIIEQEDKLGLRDAAEKWAQVITEIGAEVVVPIPGVWRVETACPECGHEYTVDYRPEISIPASKMFPQFAAEGDEE